MVEAGEDTIDIDVDGLDESAWSVALLNSETDEHRAVTNHFGRHRFTTYWRIEQDVSRQLVKYMHGDRTGAYQQDQGMNAYLHAYYEDIEELYRERIYELCYNDSFY